MIILAAPGFNFAGQVDAIFAAVGTFIGADSGPFGMAVLTFLVAVHAILGGAELASGRPSRLVSGAFWTRFIMVLVLLEGFDFIILSFTRDIVAGSLAAIDSAEAGMWIDWLAKAQQQVADASLMWESKASGFSILTMGFTNALELLFSVLGMWACGLFGALILIFCYFQAILGACIGAFMVALGPIALPFAMHEATQDIAIGYLKSWLVYGVFYMPALVMAFTIAGTVLTGLVNVPMTGAAYGSVFDVMDYLQNLVLAPFAALAIVMAAPALLKGAIR